MFKKIDAWCDTWQFPFLISVAWIYSAVNRLTEGVIGSGILYLLIGLAFLWMALYKHPAAAGTRIVYAGRVVSEWFDTWKSGLIIIPVLLALGIYYHYQKGTVAAVGAFVFTVMAGFQIAFTVKGWLDAKSHR